MTVMSWYLDMHMYIYIWICSYLETIDWHYELLSSAVYVPGLDRGNDCGVMNNHDQRFSILVLYVRTLRHISALYIMDCQSLRRDGCLSRLLLCAKLTGFGEGTERPVNNKSFVKILQSTNRHPEAFTIAHALYIFFQDSLPGLWLHRHVFLRASRLSESNAVLLSKTLTVQISELSCVRMANLSPPLSLSQGNIGLAMLHRGFLMPVSGLFDSHWVS
jgi:hypothetical protein